MVAALPGRAKHRGAEASFPLKRGSIVQVGQQRPLEHYRRGPLQAAFTNKELRELTSLDGASDMRLSDEHENYQSLQAVAIISDRLSDDYEISSG